MLALSLCGLFFWALIIVSTYTLTAIPNPVYSQEPEFVIADSSLKSEIVTQGLSFPTSMTFVDNKGNVLVSEKNTGRVFLVSNGSISKEPILEFTINSAGERGLL
jgi:glucose/arabinose dehydrogenase